MQDKQSIISGFLAGIVGALLVLVVLNPSASLPTQPPGTTGGTTALVGQDKLVTDVVKKTSPAVVSIVISKKVTPQQFSIDDFFNDPFFSPFNPPPPSSGGSSSGSEQEIGGGSGFFVTSDGLVVTNKHVVDDAQASYTVYTSTGDKYSATVIARDPSLDVALLRVPVKGNAYLSFADSDKLLVGQSVIAIGNALAEFRNTVSVGVVSGLARSIVAGSDYGAAERLDEVIQTDAAINPGNSGGPLLDLSGNVVGINVAVVEGSENIGFALPSNTVKETVESVEKTGKIVRPFLGVRYVPITKSLAEENHLPVDYGELVVAGENGELAVIPGSPADKAGIVENDIILSFNGTKLTEDVSLASQIRKAHVGDRATLVILHRGTQKNVTAVLEQAP